MATPYKILYDKFIKRLVNDKEFFKYNGNLTKGDIEKLSKDHMIDLLNQAISDIYKYGKPDINFYNKDDTLEQFNEDNDNDLVIQEIDLLIDLMYQKYYEEGRNKLKQLGLTFKSSEINVFSPAEDRKSFLNLVKDIEERNINSIKNYLSRDRITWEYKTIYKK